MSVVNRMLADIQARHNQTGPQYTARGVRWPWLKITMLAVLPAVLLLLWCLHRSVATPVPVVAATPRHASVRAASPAIAVATTPHWPAADFGPFLPPPAVSASSVVPMASVLPAPLPAPPVVRVAPPLSHGAVNATASVAVARAATGGAATHPATHSPVLAASGAAAHGVAKDNSPGTPSIAKQMIGPENLQAKLTLAEQQFRDGHRAEGLAAIDEYWRASGAQEAARQRIIATLLRWNLEDEAVNWIREGLQHEPQNPGYAMQLASWMMRQGHYDEAYQLLMSVQSPDGADSGYILLLAEAARRGGHAPEAVKLYRQALSSGLAPEVEARSWIGFALALETCGKYREAIDAYQSAIQNEALPDSMREAAQQAVLDLQQHSKPSSH